MSEPLRRFSVILPTIGRPSLTAALRSCDNVFVDEVIVCPDGRQAYAACFEALETGLDEHVMNVWETKVELLQPIDESRMNLFGHPQRNRAMLAASSPWLLFLDDDDVFVDGAFAKIVLALDEYRPHLFKMRYGPNSSKEGTLWQEPELREENVGTPMFVCPNQALGWWPPRRAGDFAFIAETCGLQGEPVFVNEVICDVRP